MYLEDFEQLQEKHRLAKPLCDVKAAFLAKFDAVASDDQIKCFDDWIARCGPVPASGNTSDVTSADPATQIFEPEGIKLIYLSCAFFCSVLLCFDSFISV